MPQMFLNATGSSGPLAALLSALGRSIARRLVPWTRIAPDAARALATLDSIGDGIISTDRAGRITYLNPVAAAMTGWSADEALGRSLPEVLQIVDGESRQRVRDTLALAVQHDRVFGLGANSLLIRRDGHESAIEDTAAPIRDDRGRVTGAVIVFHDVGVARALTLRMSHLAQHDGLTGLPNRLLLQDRLGQAIAAAQRHGQKLALLFVDVDRFKSVNDSRGHAFGDALLQSIGRRLAGSVRASDTVSRQGGDEFVVLLPELTRARDAAVSADKILAEMAAPHRIGGEELHVSVSIGIAVYPDDVQDAEGLLAHADLALHHAKREGRGLQRRIVPAMSFAGDGVEVRVRDRGRSVLRRG